MKHWADKFIGKPWQPGGCWLLVQEIFRERHGVTMPDLALAAEGENVAALKAAATRSGWRPIVGKAEADDVVLLVQLDGKKHVGYMVQTIRGLRLLHSDGRLDKRGKAVGETVAVPLEDVLRDGYRTVELWRRGP